MVANISRPFEFDKAEVVATGVTALRRNKIVTA